MRLNRLVAVVLGLFLSLATLAIPLGWAAPAYGATDDDPIRVGYFAFSGYHDKDATGRLSGYGYDFLQRIGAYLPDTYEYLDYEDSYSDCLDLLAAGELDLVTSVSKTPEREELFLFSDEPIGTNSTNFTVKAGNDSVVPGDYATYDGLRIGMLDGNSKNAAFERFADENGFSFEPVYFETEDELTSALQDGEVDGIVTGSLRSPKNEWVLETLSPTPFYAVTRRDDPELMAQVNEAIAQLDEDDPNWREELDEKYYAVDSGGTVMLDVSERAYIDGLRERGESLKVLTRPRHFPYSYINDDGQPDGIFPGLFDLIVQRTNLPVTYLEPTDFQNYLEMRKAGQADIVLDVPDDYYLAETVGVKLTDPYLSTSFSMLVRTGFEGEPSLIGVNDDSEVLKAYVDDTYPADMVRTYDSVDECARAVVDGEVDGAILHIYCAQQEVRNDTRNQLTTRSVEAPAESFSIGVNSAQDHTLLTILNKAIVSIENPTRTALVASEVQAGVRPVDLVGFLYTNPVYAFIAAALVAAIVIIAVLYLVRRRNAQRLQERVDEVSAAYEVQKGELSEALSMAEQANRAKTVFLNNMSHDIRTPMNAIIGFTSLASDHIDDTARVRDYLGKISVSSEHLLSLINDVLDMSRIESGKVTIEEKPEDLADILHGIKDIIEADVHAKQLTLFVNTMDVSHEQVLCDRLHINQILLNLLSNAMKFTEPGGEVSLCVTERPSDEEGRATYVFEVADTGIGMSPEFVKTIFDPFTREQSSTVSGIQGTGLGMSITKNIVDMMGGAIEVESTPGEGTVFTVTLDLKVERDVEPPAPVAETVGMRALVVDDDLTSCQAACKMLRQLGLKPEWSMYGKEAVVRTREAAELGDPYQVVFIDWAMPDLDGTEVARRIHEASPDALIVLVSAYDWSDVKEEARRAGVSLFLSKPLFVSDLADALRRTFGGQGLSPFEEGEPSEPMSFEGERLLLVEDNELNREIAQEILTEAGFEVETAFDGTEAVRLVAENDQDHYDAVLMDIQMPVMDGYEATRRIRALDGFRRSSVPIIALTADAFEEDRKRAIEAGMNGHLSKPIEVDKLLNALAAIAAHAR